jgi:hypothetical protein
MLQKIQTWLQKKQDELKKKEELLKAQKYYNYVKAGGAFIQFVQQDIAKMKKEKMNHDQRRRFEKELNDKGIMSPELVQFYQMKIDQILSQINQRMNPPKVKKQNNPNCQVRTTPPLQEKKNVA